VGGPKRILRTGDISVHKKIIFLTYLALGNQPFQRVEIAPKLMIVGQKR
jgi:hypothetical protein